MSITVISSAGLLVTTGELQLQVNFDRPSEKRSLSPSLFLSKIWPTMVPVNGRGLRVTSCFALHCFKAGNGLSVEAALPCSFVPRD